jgi:hypothetical protein
MNKALAVAVVLLAALAIGFATNNSASAPGSFVGPHVVAKVSMTGRAAGLGSLKFRALAPLLASFAGHTVNTP